ncbi:NAD-dependent epimerase/dehydratase family protein [Salibacterium aidingense]|uniref:NAD-dependent epimerase/dehydratase family protein n=1 Tax=Salibacterium aidingense TaxID=384933 RepID=UPI000423E0B2|nr:NAD(P)-dependent oxidoreductase [Salibacterium aidingense]
MKTVAELEYKLTQPSDELVQTMCQLDGDIIILGVGGKMGPSLAKLAKKAIDAAGLDKRVYGVSRFSSGTLQEELEAHGVQTLAADLLDDHQLQRLPEVKNVIFMAGKKFGTTGNEHFTWVMNSYLPGRVAEKFKNSRMVVFSTGNIYPFIPVKQMGVTEDEPVGPVGEYAQSCLGRERVFEHFSHKYQIPMVLFRLTYAIDMRYGVLMEIAKAVKEQKPINLNMGFTNCIWQGDANDIAIRALRMADSPAVPLNVNGPEVLSVRWVANQFAEKFDTAPIFEGEEQDSSFIRNAAKMHQLFGYPSVTLRDMMDWTSEWLDAGAETWDQPTHFQVRNGAF